MDTQRLNQRDPLQKQPERGMSGNEMNPLDPPEAYAPPALHRVPLEELHPFLRKLCDEHMVFLEELKKFDEAILAVQKTGYTKELDTQLRHFFKIFEQDFILHSRREEEALFPLLHQKLIADGEHGTGDTPTTGIDIMEDDHLKAVQLAAVVLNFMGLALRLPDEKSRLIVLDAALEQAKTLVELMRLHIFREDNVIFSSAHRLISKSEFDHM
jgi:iron-sulfur cluster repair protein YtfE (RIC family)